MRDFIVIFVTAGSPAEGERIARTLVDERLAACVNRIRAIHSVYRWQGAIEQSEEELLVIKSERALFPRLEQRVRELHSYAVPEIVALPLIEGSSDYLQWLAEQLSGGAT